MKEFDKLLALLDKDDLRARHELLNTEIIL